MTADRKPCLGCDQPAVLKDDACARCNARGARHIGEPLWAAGIELGGKAVTTPEQAHEALLRLGFSLAGIEEVDAEAGVWLIRVPDDVAAQLMAEGYTVASHGDARIEIDGT